MSAYRRPSKRWGRAEMTGYYWPDDQAEPSTREGDSCPCDLGPAGNCPGSWHGCQWYDEGPEAEDYDLGPAAADLEAGS
jgi:hypothetical protein